MFLNRGAFHLCSMGQLTIVCLQWRMITSPLRDIRLGTKLDIHVPNHVKMIPLDGIIEFITSALENPQAFCIGLLQ